MVDNVNEPRIYTYKITFEEIPDWYWGVHKERYFGEPYLGSPKNQQMEMGFLHPPLTDL